MLAVPDHPATARNCGRLDNTSGFFGDTASLVQ